MANIHRFRLINLYIVCNFFITILSFKYKFINSGRNKLLDFSCHYCNNQGKTKLLIATDKLCLILLYMCIIF